MDSIWPPVVIAIGLFVLMGAVMIVTICKRGIDEALKIWNAMVGVLGATLGMIASYFFTQVSVNQADAAREEAHAASVQHREVADRALDQSRQLLQQLDVAQREVRSMRRERGLPESTGDLSTQPEERPNG